MNSLRWDDLPCYVYDEYKLWEGSWELIHGVPYAMSPAPSIKHQKISTNIAWQLQDRLKGCKKCRSLLPVDWRINNSTIVQPDNMVICHEPRNDAFISKTPKIIFEILSPSTAKKDTTVKFSIYESESVNYYIIVNPDDDIAKIYKLNGGRYIKICDAREEVVSFELEECFFNFDFSLLWQ